MEVYERLAAENPAAFEPDLAESYNNLADFYKEVQRYNEAEQYYKRELEVYERLAAENPAEYEPNLTKSYGKLADLYDEIQRYEEAEQMRERAEALKKEK